ncbi:MAG: MBL fold metallo-hydrolase [Spirochaetaceae bacterium]|jgi:glyoxylase-like metal-dependent hydrolase (beta-lactamase superfamily II)|nr:MBL fold metallo-hydrolase [Spirochaetaceae bacterium]
MIVLTEDTGVTVFVHCCSNTVNNCYLIGADAVREAVIVDPGYLDETILLYIEDNNYALRGILVTHDHTKLRGIQSLKRIYDAPIYAVNQQIYGYKTAAIRDRDILAIGSLRFEVLLIPGHTQDSAVFRIGHLLFTGDVLSAGMVGYTPSAYSAATQMNALQSKVFSLLGDFTIFPCHGPPSSLESERRFNVGIQRYEQKKNRTRSFEPF